MRPSRPLTISASVQTSLLHQLCRPRMRRRRISSHDNRNPSVSRFDASLDVKSAHRRLTVKSLGSRANASIGERLLCSFEIEVTGRAYVTAICGHERRAERLFIAFHELAHHWLHPPGIQMFHGFGRRVEFEADVVAACALIPKTVLTHYWPSEIAELHGYTYDLVNFRCEVFDRWRI